MTPEAMTRARLATLLTVLGLWVAAVADLDSQAASVELDDLAILIQSNREEEDVGCDAAYLYSIRDSTPIFRLPDLDLNTTMTGLSSTTDFAELFILSGSPDGRLSPSYQPRLERIRASPGNWNEWSVSPTIVGGRFTMDRAVAIMPDDETLLIEEYGGPGADENETGIARYCLSEVAPGGRLGPRRGFFRTRKAEFQIIPSQDGRHAHLVPPQVSLLFTLDVASMKPSSQDITILADSGVGDSEPFNEFMGTISPDEKYLVTRRENYDRLGIIDLVNRRMTFAPLSGLCPGSRSCGEPAFNHGPVNHGLLAVRGTSELAVFEFSAGSLGRKIGKLPLAPASTFAPPLAWSGDGSHIIVATSRPNGDEFLVVRVEDDGRRLTEERSLRSCTDRLGNNFPHMILTANRRMARVSPPIACVPPTPTVTPTVTQSITPTNTRTSPPTSTMTPSPAPTMTPTATHTPLVLPSPTTTAVPTSTRLPVPVYLPILLREQCLPSQRRVDVVLVIDASSSMLEPTVTGRTKMAAAIEAAQSFLNHVRLDAGDQAAVVSFHRDAFLLTPLTNTRATLAGALAGIQTAQFTRIDRGIGMARDELLGLRHNANNTPVMIVLTDGRANPVPAEVAVQEAQRAKDAGVVVFTIGLGADLDLGALQSMATRPDHCFLAPDAEELAGIYRGIAVAIPCPASAYWGQRR